jgi:hypothetical protein
MSEVPSVSADADDAPSDAPARDDREADDDDGGKAGGLPRRMPPPTVGL